PVAPAVDVDPDAVRWELGVAAHEAPHHRRVHLHAVDADVERIVVVEDAHLRALAGGRPLEREVLGEGVGRDGRAPGRVVEPAVDEADVGEHAYVYARFGGERPRLLLNAHVDTVPANSGYSSPPHLLVKRGDRLHGLGTADTKGAIAAILEALAALGGRAPKQ